MLPTELLMFRVNAGLVQPRRVKATPGNLALVAALTGLFESNLGNKRFQLEDDLKALEVGRSDYRMVRGLAHLLANDCAEFGTGGLLEPAVVRAKVFGLAQAHPPSRSRRQAILEQAARELSGDVPLSGE